MIPRLGKPTQLSDEQIECLQEFARFEVSLEQLRFCLKQAMNFDFDAEQGARWMETRFEIPIPGILITKQHIEGALQKRKDGVITEQQLVEWATMILHNHAYELDERDEDTIAQWLNDISFDLRPYSG